MQERLVKNQYLSHVGRDNHSVPRGEDRVAINKSFKALVDTFEVKEQGTVLFSKGQSNESIERIPLPEINKENQQVLQWC